MPRKKSPASPAVTPPHEAVAAAETTTTIDAAPTADCADAVVTEAGRSQPTDYKAVFTSADGVELGEDVRFRQRVIRFKERPDAQTLDTLKDNGFTYRPREKAWTVPATPESPAFTDRLVREMSGGERER